MVKSPIARMQVAQHRSVKVCGVQHPMGVIFASMQAVIQAGSQSKTGGLLQVVLDSRVCPYRRGGYLGTTTWSISPEVTIVLRLVYYMG